MCTIASKTRFKYQILTITYNLNGNRNIIGCDYYEFSSGILIENIKKQVLIATQFIVIDAVEHRFNYTYIEFSLYIDKERRQKRHR